VETPDEVFKDDFVDAEEPPEYNNVPTEEDLARIMLPVLTPRLAFAAGVWWVWSGAKWEMDSKEGLRAELVVRERLSSHAIELRQTGEALGKEGGGHRRMAARLQSNAGIRAVISLLRALLARDMQVFDGDVMVLNTPSGLVDLRSGKVRPTEPADYVTRSTNVAMPDHYDPVKAPNWDAFLEYLTRGDREYRAFLQRYMGYALTGRMDEKKLVFIYGAASNTGKSTFVNAVQYAMGDYARSVDVDIFMSRQSNSDQIAQLPGVRLVTATEPSAGQRWEDRLIKSVTGRDPITARRLYQSFFTFEPQFKILIAGNHQPELREVDTALLKRVLISPMDRVARDPDVMLGDKLRTEAGMILRWMLEGCLAWQKRGLDAPDAVTAKTQEYAEMEDTLMLWVDEECVLDGDTWTTTEELYNSWKGWQMRQGMKYVAPLRRFSRELNARDLGIQKAKRGRSNGFGGIKLSEEF